MKLKPYPEYKDSGVEWIGEIPQNWEMRRLKYNCSVNPPGKKSLSDPKAKVNFLPMEKVSEEGDYDLESKTEYENVSSGYTYFEDSDVLLAKITPCFENGKGALVENLKYGFGFGTTEFHILRYGTEIHPKYLYFLTKSHLFRVIGEAFMEGAAGQKRVSTDFVKNFPMPTPSMAEQKLIVNYLEKKTSEIDLTIEKDTRLIELLKEKRTTLINHVVTKGLDPTAEMKDSGVEWIGEIPEDWEVNKTKKITDVKISNVDKKSKENEPEVFLCNYTDVYNHEFITSKLDFMKATASVEQVKKLSLRKGDVIITKDSETQDDIAVPALVNEDLENVVCGYHLALIRPHNNEIIGDFLFRLLQSRKINDQFVVAANGVTRFGISTYPIKNSYLTLPPLDQQELICKYLNHQSSKIDLTIEKIGNNIELLEEYKKSLIHHVVTGKVDVREVAV